MARVLSINDFRNESRKERAENQNRLDNSLRKLRETLPESDPIWKFCWRYDLEQAGYVLVSAVRLPFLVAVFYMEQNRVVLHHDGSLEQVKTLMDAYEKDNPREDSESWGYITINTLQQKAV